MVITAAAMATNTRIAMITLRNTTILGDAGQRDDQPSRDEQQHCGHTVAAADHGPPADRVEVPAEENRAEEVAEGKQEDEVRDLVNSDETAPREPVESGGHGAPDRRWPGLYVPL